MLFNRFSLAKPLADHPCATRDAKERRAMPSDGEPQQKEQFGKLEHPELSNAKTKLSVIYKKQTERAYKQLIG